MNGLWRNEESTILVRLRDMGSTSNCVIKILKSTDAHPNLDNLKLYPVMPKKDFNIRLQNWFLVGRFSSVAEVLIVPIVDDWVNWRYDPNAYKAGVQCQ
jgi:hypothetical protein